ncbi:MAG: LysM peptidoglycan-binding domain-containing protein [Bacillota bacterium]|nr:LysM peptidoglycan-binding domain-containing protein [Bacillota bacterium]
MYRIYFGKQPFPLAPESIKLKIKGRNETVELLDGGEINRLNRPGLTEVSFKLELPYERLPLAHYPDGYKPPELYTGILEALMLGRKPFQFIVVRDTSGGDLRHRTNLTVSLEDYSIDEIADEGDALIVDVSLKQYRAYGPRQIKIEQKTGTATTKPSRSDASNPNVGAKTHTVVRGDTLWAIARRYLGDGRRYKDIYNLNKGKIKDPHWIYPGQVFLLPAK